MESGWNVWVWLVGVVLEQEVGVASGNGWNLWVWLLGVVARRYIDFLILLIPTPLFFFAATSLLFVHFSNIYCGVATPGPDPGKICLGRCKNFHAVPRAVKAFSLRTVILMNLYLLHARNHWNIRLQTVEELYCFALTYVAMEARENVRIS